MTQLIIGIAIGILVGFGAALWLNHRQSVKFDKLTEKADAKVDKLREKL